MKLRAEETKKTDAFPKRRMLIHALKHTIEAGTYGKWARDSVWDMVISVPAIIDAYHKKYARKYGPLELKDDVWHRFRDRMNARPKGQPSLVSEEEKLQSAKVLQKMIRCNANHAIRIVEAYIAVHQTLPPFTPLVKTKVEKLAA